MGKTFYKLTNQQGKWEIGIDPARGYGYMLYDDFDMGGLWFNGKSLIDYDGVLFLPRHVIKAIRAMGYHVSNDFIFSGLND